MRTVSSCPDTLAHHVPCRGCAHHVARGAGCAVVELRGKVPLDGFLGRDPCFLKDQLRRFVERYLAHRPRSLFDPDDLVQEVGTRLLADPIVRKGGFALGLHAFLAYLRQTAVRCAISAERRERGRVRCGNCKHYASYSGVCLCPGIAWTHKEMESTQDPRALDPACREFSAKRAPVPLLPENEQATSGERFGEDRESDISEAVQQALIALAEVHPRAALVVRARLLDGKTYEGLTQVSASVRTMKRDFALGVAFLRKRLAVFQQQKMAPKVAEERLKAAEHERA